MRLLIKYIYITVRACSRWLCIDGKDDAQRLWGEIKEMEEALAQK